MIKRHENGRRGGTNNHAKLNNLKENLSIRRNKKNYARLMESIRQLKSGKAQVRTLIEEE